MTMIRRKSDGAAIADAKKAVTFAERLRGLIGTTRFEPGQGLYFPKCNSVHMWFMSIAIDVVFLAAGGRVTSVRPALKPWRVFPAWDLRARDALELPVGTVAKFGIQPGDVLCID